LYFRLLRSFFPAFAFRFFTLGFALFDFLALAFLALFLFRKFANFFRFFRDPIFFRDSRRFFLFGLGLSLASAFALLLLHLPHQSLGRFAGLSRDFVQNFHGLLGARTLRFRAARVVENPRFLFQLTLPAQGIKFLDHLHVHIFRQRRHVLLRHIESSVFEKFDDCRSRDVELFGNLIDLFLLFSGHERYPR